MQKNAIKKKVLVVEDNPIILDSIATLMQDNGYEAFKAKNALEAIDAFNNADPGVVIMDFNLPDDDGDRIINRIKEKNPAVQVIVITGYGDYDVLVRSMQSGAGDYINKPVDDAELLESVEKSFSEYFNIHYHASLRHVLLVTDDSSLEMFCKKTIKTDKVVIKRIKNMRDLDKDLAAGVVDIAILDLRGRNDISKQLISISELMEGKDVCFMLISDLEDERAVFSALKLGSIQYLRYPEDMDKFSILFNKTLRQQEYRRLSSGKMEELKKSTEIIARITGLKDIEIDLSRIHGSSEASLNYAVRFLDNIPVGVIAVDENMKVIFCNKYLKQYRKNIKSIDGPEFIELINRMGIFDVSFPMIRNELANIIHKSEEIENIVLGRTERITLSNISVFSEKGSKVAALILIK
jgi:DNA-binding NtrC family response regulator